MKHMTRILSLGLLLSVSTLAFAGHGHDRNHRDGYYGGQHHHGRQNNRHYAKKHHRGKRHHFKNNRHAGCHPHHGRYRHDWHARRYVSPRVIHKYNRPGVMIVYEPGSGFYVGGGY